MAVHDFSSQRLFIDAVLAAGVRISCDNEQANYLLNVLRLRTGNTILVFNGRDGEWRATVATAGKRGASLEITEQTREQEGGPDIHYFFAPLKRARLDYMVQKATELGVARLVPVITRRTIAERVNLERLRANAIEAAEQCGILRVPDIGEPAKLEHVLGRWDNSRRLIYCDEAAAVGDPVAVLRKAFGERAADLANSPPVAVLIGPEGGFDPSERDILMSKPFTVPISLGPRVMRADTAAIAALAIVNTAIGDWR